jgi:glycosyltransferase involved in cell wall biosynthesis
VFDPILQSVWCVVPVYNNPDTVADVVRRCCEQLPNVLVVDDGSDRPVKELLAGLPATVLRHDRNRGKGAALRTALDYIQEQRGAWMITLDADGQHDPADIPSFFPAMRVEPNAVYIGARDFDAPNIPGSSRFGRRFSNFWVQLETGKTLQDTQSGFRAYPTALVSQLPLHSSYYDFEIEVLVRAAWAGLDLRSVPISVWYPPKEERVSSFDKRKDNLRLTRMHMRLIGRRLVPWPVHRLVKRDRFSVWELLRSPRRCIQLLLHENATPLGLAVAGGVGLLLGTLPLVMVHTLVILYVTARLNLNKVMALSIQTLCAPPVVPILCIEVGHFLHRGTFFVPDSPESVFADLHEHLFHWLIGSLVLAPIIGLLGGLAVYAIARQVQAGKGDVPRKDAKDELSAHSASLREDSDPEQEGDPLT